MSQQQRIYLVVSTGDTGTDYEAFTTRRDAEVYAKAVNDKAEATHDDEVLDDTHATVWDLNVWRRGTRLT